MPPKLFDRARVAWSWHKRSEEKNILTLMDALVVWLADQKVFEVQVICPVSNIYQKMDLLIIETGDYLTNFYLFISALA